nr:MAG TPA: hypothetical protein [Caudoviricetes sp.]
MICKALLYLAKGYMALVEIFHMCYAHKNINEG